VAYKPVSQKTLDIRCGDQINNVWPPFKIVTFALFQKPHNLCNVSKRDLLIRLILVYAFAQHLLDALVKSIAGEQDRHRACQSQDVVCAKLNLSQPLKVGDCR
jgi:hypothetical protein